jgi:hypothetical protein
MQNKILFEANSNHPYTEQLLMFTYELLNILLIPEIYLLQWDLNVSIEGFGDSFNKRLHFKTWAFLS